VSRRTDQGDDSDRADPLRAVAAELYALPLDRFVPERTERVRAARTDGDRGLAEAIGRLPKPTVAAWLVNLLVRERADRTGQLLELGATLRQAQAELDPAALRELGAQRRRLVALVADEAQELAGGVGRHPGQSVLDEVAETLNAAMVSEAAGTAVATGRLVKALPVEGIDDAELDLFVAVPPTGARPRPRAVGGASAADQRRTREREEARRAVETAERAVEDASGRAEDAAASLQQGEQRIAARTARIEELRARIDELRRQLNDAEDDLQESEDALATARSEHRASRRALDDAEEALATARAAERRLG
jgi:hypothetical protein